MDWYDRVELYERLFSWDPSVERAFILGASARWGIARPRRILEPFCGPGRLLRAMPGTCIGFDKNPNMVRFAQKDCRVFRADAGRFATAPASFDLAYCLVDSFRYLLDEASARRHLASVAAALRPGAVYVLGFELEGDLSVDVLEHRGVEARIGMLGDADPATRIETLRVRLRADGEAIESFAPMRTYSAQQVEELIDDQGSFEVAAAFGPGYDLSRTVELPEVDGSLLLVLQRAR